jgi:hypothetical protein
MFGESWDAAITANKVYNAKDAAEMLGVDASGINEKWSKLSPGVNLIKFGGGESTSGKFHNVIINCIF